MWGGVVKQGATTPCCVSNTHTGTGHDRMGSGGSTTADRMMRRRGGTQVETSEVKMQELKLFYKAATLYA